MKFYRGDNICNKLTEPNLYRFDGLRTKAFGKGDPAYIEKHGLLDTIRQHINPDKKSNEDQNLYNTTPFISFSTNIDRAFYWLTDKNRFEIEKCKIDFSETRYLFECEIPDSEVIEKGKGIYSFNFICNPSLKTSNFLDPILDSALPFMYGTTECPICNMSYKFHEIILIDTKVFLHQYKEKEKYKGAHILAEEDKEWLILPFDTMDKNGFKYNRIPRADFWKVKHFDLKTGIKSIYSKL